MQLSVHKEPPEVGLVKKGNQKFVIVSDTARANPIMNKSQETTDFHGRQKLTTTMKQRPEK